MKKKKKSFFSRLDKKWRVTIIVAGVLLLIALLLAIKIYVYASKVYDGPEVRVNVLAEGGEKALHDSICASLGDDYGERVYNIWEKMADKGSLRSGSYLVKPGSKAWQIARKIKNRQQDPIRITFNNIRTMAQLADRIAAQTTVTPAQFLHATDSILSSLGVTPPNYPAYFLPDTYEIYWTDDAATIVNRLSGYYKKFWNGSRRARARELGLTPEQISTLASIVEEETNKRDERPMVARLYLNRLNKGMMLQADPTVKFAVGDFSLRRITNKHLEVASPYNTYRVKGLPPGPIRIPSAESIEAVLKAPVHPFIYMCAKEDFSGYHNFAVDYGAHMENARRYQAELNRKGIK